MNPRKLAALLAVAMGWTVLCMTIAVKAAGADNRFGGMVVGTVISAVAFIPPAMIFYRWYERQRAVERDAIAAFHAERRDDASGE